MEGEGAISSASQVCGGCVIVADVAGIVWYEELAVNTAATALVGVGVGSNGSRVTRTSIVQNSLEFTFDPQASGQYPTVMVTNAAVLPSTEIAGATLYAFSLKSKSKYLDSNNAQDISNGVQCLHCLHVLEPTTTRKRSVLHDFDRNYASERLHGDISFR